MSTAPDTSTTITLTRLLTHLERSLLSPPSASSTTTPPTPSHGTYPHHTQPSQYELRKTRANLTYARTLLLTLEKQSSTLRVQSQRQQVQAELKGKREVVKKLSARLGELEQTRVEEEEGGSEGNSSEDESEGEEERERGGGVSYAPARRDVEDGLEVGGGGELGEVPPELRSRRLDGRGGGDAATAATSGRDQLFAARSTKPAADPSLSRNETLLSHNRAEQETLTTGLLGLARALKESSLQFSSSIEAEKDVLKRAEGGLDKNAAGMEAAERKMGMLRRMSEGQGWWGRMKLYAFIFALWVVAFLVVFVGPKLRL